VAFDEFDLVEHRTRDVIDEDRAARSALAGEQGSVHGDGVQSRRHAADREAGQVAAGVEFAVDARQADRDLTCVHVGQIPELVGRGDVLDVLGVAHGGDGRGAAFAFAGDLESVAVL
jgi:hypothetical protein